MGSTRVRIPSSLKRLASVRFRDEADNIEVSDFGAQVSRSFCKNFCAASRPGGNQCDLRRQRQAGQTIVVVEARIWLAIVNRNFVFVVTLQQIEMTLSNLHLGAKAESVISSMSPTSR